MKYLFFGVFFFFGARAIQPQPISAVRVVNSYPINGAQNVHPATGIGISFSSPIIKNSMYCDSITVTGTINEKYSGTVRISTNRKTVIFIPSKPFPFGETINVRFGRFETISEAMTPAYSLTFTIRTKLAIVDTSFHSDDPILENQIHKTLFHATGPATLSYPIFNIITENNPSNGEMFIANYKNLASQTNTYRMILDKYGEVTYGEGGGPDYFDDFKPNQDGTYSFYDQQNGAFFILDTNFTLINIIGATYGYVTDAHEIRVTSEGNYFILAADYEFIDMSSYVKGGFNSATVLVPIIQEFDRDSNLIFEWRTIDHFKITDATHEDLTSNYIDFCHVNAIEFDADSNLIISCRHFDEITKIDRETGDIIWRWGGKNNQFTFVGDTLLFSHQHAIRRTDAGTYIMFDNGNFHPPNAYYSRALEYRLDQTNKIATKIWQFRHIPDVYSLAMGYVQRLPNHNTFIGWGEADDLTVTELDPNDQTLYEMGMTDGNYTYRAYKYDSNYVHGRVNSSVAQSATESNITTLICMPNPISDQGHIECSAVQSGNVAISLFDQLGREISKIYTGVLSSGKHSFLMNAKEFPAGMYYLRATGDDGLSIEKKILIMK